MPEINIQNEFYKRLDEFKHVEAEIIKEQVDLEYTVHAVLTVGLDLMMADFFRQLDDQTLQKSIDQFYQEYPNSKKVEPSKLTGNGLVGILVTLSNTYPKQLFPKYLMTKKNSSLRRSGVTTATFLNGTQNPAGAQCWRWQV
jgi:hypothetical protein